MRCDTFTLTLKVLISSQSKLLHASTTCKCRCMTYHYIDANACRLSAMCAEVSYSYMYMYTYTNAHASIIINLVTKLIRDGLTRGYVKRLNGPKKSAPMTVLVSPISLTLKPIPPTHERIECSMWYKCINTVPK